MLTRHRIVWVVVVTIVAAASAAAYIAFDSSNHEANCESLKQAAQVDFQAGRLQAAQDKFEAAVKEAEQSKNAMQLPMVLFGLAGVYEKVNQLSKAEDCLVRALALNEKLGATDAQTVDRGTRLIVLRKTVEAEIALARIQKRKRHFTEARKTYESAIKHEKEDPHQVESLALIREYITVLEALGEKDLATRTEIEAESNFGTSGDFFKFTTQATKAVFESNLADAEKWFRIAYLISKNHGDNDRAASSVNLIAMCRLLQKKYTEADKYIQESLAIKLPENKNVQWITVKNLQLAAFSAYLQGKSEEGDRLCQQARDVDPVLAVSPESFVLIRNYYNIHGEKRDNVILLKMLLSWHEPMVKSNPTNTLYEWLIDEYGAAKMDQKCIDALKSLNKLLGKGQNEIKHLNAFQASTVAQAYSRLRNFKEESRCWRAAYAQLDKFPQLRFMVTRALAYSLIFSKDGHDEEAIKFIIESWQHVDARNLNTAELGGDIGELGRLYESIGKPRSRFDILKDAHSLAVLKWKVPALTAWLDQKLAHQYQAIYDWPKAIASYKSFIAFEQKKGFTSDLMDSQARLSWCYLMDGQLYEARKLASEVIAAKCPEEYWSRRLKAHCQYNLAVIYEKEGKHELAIKTLEEARSMCPDIESSLTWAAMAVFALTYEKKNYEFAENICLEHLEHGKSAASSAAAAALMNTLADIYTGDRKFDKADFYYKSALAIFSKLNGRDVRAMESTCKNHYQISLKQRKEQH